MAEPAQNRRELARALARVPSGLFVLSAGSGARAQGMLASWVQQSGFVPPSLTVAVQKDRAVLPLIRETRTFCISVLGADDRTLFARFAKGGEDGAAFQGVRTELASNGVPFPADCHALLVCRLLGEASWSDHVILCGEVVDGGRRDAAAPRVHLRENGLSY